MRAGILGILFTWGYLGIVTIFVILGRTFHHLDTHQYDLFHYGKT